MKLLQQIFYLFFLLLLMGNSLQASEALERGIEAFDNDNFSAALEQWAPLAEQDHAEAQLFMAVLYRYGLGVEQDPAKAAYWYELAANNGEVDAQSEIGYFYETGIGVKQDVWTAESWYQMVIERDICLSDTLATGRLDVKDKYR